MQTGRRAQASVYKLANHSRKNRNITQGCRWNTKDTTIYPRAMSIKCLRFRQQTGVQTRLTRWLCCGLSPSVHGRILTLSALVRIVKPPPGVQIGWLHSPPDPRSCAPVSHFACGNTRTPATASLPFPNASGFYRVPPPAVVPHLPRPHIGNANHIAGGPEPLKRATLRLPDSLNAGRMISGDSPTGSLLNLSCLSHGTSMRSSRGLEIFFLRIPSSRKAHAHMA